MGYFIIIINNCFLIESIKTFAIQIQQFVHIKHFLLYCLHPKSAIFMKFVRMALRWK